MFIQCAQFLPSSDRSHRASIADDLQHFDDVVAHPDTHAVFEELPAPEPSNDGAGDVRRLKEAFSDPDCSQARQTYVAKRPPP